MPLDAKVIRSQLALSETQYYLSLDDYHHFLPTDSQMRLRRAAHYADVLDVSWSRGRILAIPENGFLIIVSWIPFQSILFENEMNKASNVLGEGLSEED